MRLNKDVLPVAGIVAFAGCSVNALANFFFAMAKDDTSFFWVAAALVELYTAWVAWSIVEVGKKLSESNLARQDRRFYRAVLGAFILLAVPSLSVSVIANRYEFGGNLLLGFLFPLLLVACAVGLAMPQVVSKYELDKQAERKEKARERQEKSIALQAAVKVAERSAQEEELARQALVKQEASKEQGAAIARQEAGNQYARLGQGTKAVLQAFAGNPQASQAQVAQGLRVSRQAVGQHLGKLAAMGAIRRNGDGVVVLWDIKALEGVR